VRRRRRERRPLAISFCRRSRMPPNTPGTLSSRVTSFVPPFRSGRRGAESMTIMSQRTGVPTIRFDAALYTIDRSTVLRLPEKASKKLPSRGQVAVQGTINGHQFQTVLEPDGNFGHWLKIDRKLTGGVALRAGQAAALEIEAVKEWPEPNVPQD